MGDVYCWPPAVACILFSSLLYSPPLVTGVWSQSLLQLRGLTELDLDMAAGPAQDAGLHLSPLTHLTSLRLAMCRTLDTVCVWGPILQNQLLR